MADITGQSILIAGATGGLGRAIVKILSRHDCSLSLIHLSDDESYAELKHQLKNAVARIEWHQCDFTQVDEIRDAIDTFFEQHKRPYGLVNLIGDPARVDWRTGQITHFQEAFLKNASAPLFAAKEFGLRLKTANRPGAIVLFSSMQGVYPFENSLYYGTSKAALIHGAKILAKEFGGNPFVRVNTIAPGVNQAGMAEESIRKGKYQKFLDRNIIPHYGTAESVAGLVLFLLDPELYMSGQIILYDGGMTLRRDLSDS